MGAQGEVSESGGEDEETVYHKGYWGSYTKNLHLLVTLCTIIYTL